MSVISKESDDSENNSKETEEDDPIIKRNNSSSTRSVSEDDEDEEEEKQLRQQQQNKMLKIQKQPPKSEDEILTKKRILRKIETTEEEGASIEKFSGKEMKEEKISDESEVSEKLLGNENNSIDDESDSKKKKKRRISANTKSENVTSESDETDEKEEHEESLSKQANSPSKEVVETGLEAERRRGRRNRQNKNYAMLHEGISQDEASISKRKKETNSNKRKSVQHLPSESKQNKKQVVDVVLAADFRRVQEEALASEKELPSLDITRSQSPEKPITLNTTEGTVDNTHNLPGSSSISTTTSTAVSSTMTLSSTTTIATTTTSTTTESIATNTPPSTTTTINSVPASQATEKPVVFKRAKLRPAPAVVTAPTIVPQKPTLDLSEPVQPGPGRMNSLNVSEIIKGFLFIGAGYDPNNRCVTNLPNDQADPQIRALRLAWFQMNNVTYALNMAGSPLQKEIQGLSYPTEWVEKLALDVNDLDVWQPDMFEKFNQAAQFIQKAYEDHQRHILTQDRQKFRPPSIFVHCVAGVNRSPFAVVWWLVKYHNVYPEKAWELVRKRRDAGVNWIDATLGGPADFSAITPSRPLLDLNSSSSASTDTKESDNQVSSINYQASSRPSSNQYAPVADAVTSLTEMPCPQINSSSTIVNTNMTTTELGKEEIENPVLVKEEATSINSEQRLELPRKCPKQPWYDELKNRYESKELG